jgi:hypothetical protein
MLDAELSNSQPLDRFLPTFFQQHPEVKPSIELSEQKLTTRRQFARDVPSLVRINGCPLDGNSDHEKVANAVMLIKMASVGRPPEWRELIPELANQSLGLVLFEKIVGKYSEVGLLVKQTWHHYCDVSLTRQEAQIYFFAIFQLVNMEVRKCCCCCSAFSARRNWIRGRIAG